MSRLAWRWFSSESRRGRQHMTLKKERQMATKKKTKRAAAKTAALKKPRLTKAQQLAKAKREIARRNKIYAEASAAEKRVLIAKDVIAQLKAKRIFAETGTWTDLDVLGKAQSFNEEAGFQETFLTDNSLSCNCCAVGSLFIGCTLYANKLPNYEIRDNWELGENLISRKKFANGFEKLFSPKQLGLIELAFEGRSEFFTDDEWFDYEAPKLSAKENTAARVRYYDAFKSERDRLIAIMENIIENNGTFEP